MARSIEKLQLDERRKAILMEIISDYVATAEPVGSRAIAKKHFENLSPATIRNVMSDLEDLGYLRQPHASAGRIPTDKGYRYFVDHILPGPRTADEPGIIGDYYDRELKNQPLEEVLESACNLLSKTSNQTGLVMVPSFSHMLFKHIEFVKVGKNEALAVFISEMGVLQNKIIPVEEDFSQEKLTSISNYLNREFKDKSVNWIRAEILRRVKFEKEHYDQLIKRALDLWTRTFDDHDRDKDADLLVNGIINFFDQPEFSADLEAIKVLFKAVEEKTKLIKLLDLCLEHDGMTIIIGEESEEEEMQGCSLIAQNYRVGDEKAGTMAIFGPKRMDYQKMIAIVNNTAKTVSKLLSERKKRS
ncbi:MAG: heat-inducible transcription repressor HrcA [Nitrospinae bacterium]|nr:heat-inducible transcription repressor HrcA [Nitrospinota bacterium]